MSDDATRDLPRLRRERDLYRRLLGLSEQDDLEPFLSEALALIVEVTGAARGLLELNDPSSENGERRWSMVHGLDENQVERVRAATSEGIIARALATGTTIVTASAASDPRFRDQKSVQMGRIDAVLCAPIGSFPPLGVLYLQGRVEPGAFVEDDRDAAEAVTIVVPVASARAMIPSDVAARTRSTSFSSSPCTIDQRRSPCSASGSCSSRSPRAAPVTSTMSASASLRNRSRSSCSLKPRRRR